MSARKCAIACGASLLWTSFAHAAPDSYQPADVTEASSAQVARAREARQNNNPGMAISLLEPIVRAHPNYFLAHYNLGLAYDAAHRTEDAIAQLQIAKKLNEDLRLREPTIGGSLGFLYLSSGRYADAVTELESASSPDIIRRLDSPSRRVVLNNLGLAYSRAGRSCEAGVSYELAKSIPQVDATAPLAAGLSGAWIVADWTPQGFSQPRQKKEWKVTGSLVVEAGTAGGAYHGTMLLCVKDPKRASAFDVHERMTIAVDHDVVRMNGLVSSGAVIWDNDSIKATVAGYSLTGQADGGSAGNDNVHFEKLW